MSDGYSSHAPSTGTRRSGWTTFAGIVLVVTGVARVFDSVWAFQYHRALQGALFGTSLNVYGWLWLLTPSPSTGPVRSGTEPMADRRRAH
ncbi:MAG TPA: hypothetical protein VFN60_08785 [Acidimicrobiales bacterium]|nr:hypothetical protein [Acidimicrobiales bacterium]